MSTKVYKNNGAIIIEVPGKDIVYLNTDDTRLYMSGEVFMINDGQVDRTYEIGVYTNITTELGGTFATHDLCYAYFLNILETGSIVSNSAGVIGVYNPLQVMEYSRLMTSNVDLVRSSSIGFTGATVIDLFEGQYTTMINETGSAVKTIDIVFNLSVQSILAVLQTSTGNFSNIKFYLLFSNGVALPILDESADNTKFTVKRVKAPDVIGANGIRMEFHTTDDISLSSILIPQVNLQNALIQGISTITGDLENIASTGKFLNVFSKDKEYESPVNKWGQNDDIDTGTTPETVYDGSDLYTYTDIGSEIAYAASSTSTSDVGKVITAYLITVDPGNGDYIEEFTTLTLNGQVPVLFAPASGNLVVACNRVYNSNGILLVGDIYIYESDAAVVIGIPTLASKVRAIITIEAQQTRQTPYVIPDIDIKGNRILEGHILKWYAAVFKTNTVVADIYFMVQEPGGVMRARDVGTTTNGIPAGYTWGDKAPLKIPTKSRIEVRCVNISANNGAIVGKYQLQRVTSNEAS